MESWLHGLLTGESEALVAGVEHVAPRLLAAVALGGLLVWRPWQRRGRPKAEIAQTQLLMCVAAALIVAVIGDSVARAFGVVGLGGFIRFRTGIKDPRDAAVLFLLIGVGMAAGLGMYELAAASASLVALILAGLGLLSDAVQGTERVRLLVETERPDGLEAALATSLGSWGYRTLSLQSETATGRVWLEVEGPAGLVGAWEKRCRKAGRLLSWERIGAKAASPAADAGEKVA